MEWLWPQDEPSGAPATRLVTLGGRYLVQGLWLVERNSLMRGQFCPATQRFEFRFFMGSRGTMTRQILVIDSRLGERIDRALAAQGISADQQKRLERASLWQVACWLRDTFTAGLTGRPASAGRVPVASQLLRRVRFIRLQGVRRVAAVIDHGLDALVAGGRDERVGVVVRDGRLYAASLPAPEPPPRRFRPSATSRRRVVAVGPDALRPMDLSLDQLVERTDARAAAVLEAWRRQAAYRLRHDAQGLAEQIADCYDGGAEWDGKPVPTFYCDAHHTISLQDTDVRVCHRSAQPWYVSSPSGTVYRFDGHCIEASISPDGAIAAVRITEPAAHRYVGSSGAMCLPGARERIRIWQDDASLSLGEVVGRVFKMYATGLRMGGVLNNDPGLRAFDSLAAYRLRDGAAMDPGVPFYPYSGRPSPVRP